MSGTRNNLSAFVEDSEFGNFEFRDSEFGEADFSMQSRNAFLEDLYDDGVTEKPAQNSPVQEKEVTEEQPSIFDRIVAPTIVLPAAQPSKKVETNNQPSKKRKPEENQPNTSAQLVNSLQAENEYLRSGGR